LVAVKPNHAGNCELVRRIVAQMRKPLVSAQTFAPPPGEPKGTSSGQTGAPDAEQADGAMDIEGVMRILPHRYPFLMVDRVNSIEGNHITALKSITINEPYFQGHFPAHPIMPGVLQLEAIAQVAGILMLRRAENTRQLA